MKISFLSSAWFIGAFLLLTSVLILACRAKGQKDTNLFYSPSFEKGVYLKMSFHNTSDRLAYRILFPEHFDPAKKHPVLLFLHGAGERGNDNTAQLIHGGDLIKHKMNQLGGIAIFPQCPEDDYWIEIRETDNKANGIRNFEPNTEKVSKSLGHVIQLVEKFSTQDFVYPNRIYVAGLSMGGMGTFDLCWRMPNTFAAASAICGAGSTEKAKEFSQLPLRIYHGEDDVVVSVEESKEMIRALRSSGGNPEVFLYPGVNHNSWDNAFSEPDFIEWMFEKVRK